MRGVYAGTPSIATDSSLLMTLLFGLGVMNLFWIAVLAAIVLLEKLSTHGGDCSIVGVRDTPTARV